MLVEGLDVLMELDSLWLLDFIYVSKAKQIHNPTLLRVHTLYMLSCVSTHLKEPLCLFSSSFKCECVASTFIHGQGSSIWGLLEFHRVPVDPWALLISTNKIVHELYTVQVLLQFHRVPGLFSSLQTRLYVSYTQYRACLSSTEFL